jgi:acetylornithine deacetylase/succinyl-diaminopimelate desuccinylase-like protein
MKPAGTFTELARLVAIDTVSPMSAGQLDACAAELAGYDCHRIGPELFGRGDPAADVWLYGHVDTKPARPREEWRTDPFTLTERDGYWYGLGTSDSKFQLLNALGVAPPDEHFVLVDTSEEHDGSGAAAAFLADHAPRTMVVCDGAVAPGFDVFSGYSGQFDGVVRLDTGREPAHPARGGGDVGATLALFLADARASDLRLTVTGLSAPVTERSLSLQQAEVRIDVRMQPDDLPALRGFLDRWPHSTRQLMYPVVGRAPLRLPGLVCGGVTPTANRLGRADGPPVEHLVVVPGADPDNRNHQPNEFIRPAQIERHRDTLRRVLAALKGKVR